MGEYSADIKRGMELLDRIGPSEWRKRISRPLDMGDPYECVLGQIYGRFSFGLTALHLEYPSTEYGFMTEDLTRKGFDLLNREWEEALNRAYSHG